MAVKQSTREKRAGRMESVRSAHGPLYAAGVPGVRVFVRIPKHPDAVLRADGMAGVSQVSSRIEALGLPRVVIVFVAHYSKIHSIPPATDHGGSCFAETLADCRCLLCPSFAFVDRMFLYGFAAVQNTLKSHVQNTV